MSVGSTPIRVLTVDDHPLVREGIAGLIGVQTLLRTIRAVHAGKKSLSPDLVPDRRASG